MRERRLEPFYHDPCVYPLNFREKGNVDRKTIMGAGLVRCLCPNIRHDLWNVTYELVNTGALRKPSSGQLLSSLPGSTMHSTRV